MDIKGFLLDGLDRLRLMCENFVNDALRLLKALGIWAVPFVAAEVALAVIPLILVMNVGTITDAIIGARGIGTTTIDVTRGVRVFVWATIAGFVSFAFLSRFEGRAAAIGQTFSELLTVILLTVFLLNENWWGVAFFTAILLPLRVLLGKIPFIRYALVVPAVYLFTACATKVIEYAVIRAITVGEAMTTVAASGVLAVVVCVLVLRHEEEKVERG